MIFIPNLLTLARFGLVPVFVVLLQEQQFLLSLMVFVVAGLTDALDGFIAKRFNATTKIGALLDPLADKVLLISAYVMMAVMGLIPFWLMVVVVFRDLVIVGGYLIIVLFYEAPRVEPSKISKLNTCLQIIYIVSVLCSLSWNLEIDALNLMLGIAVLITSVLSGSWYVKRGAAITMDLTEPVNTKSNKKIK